MEKHYGLIFSDKLFSFNVNLPERLHLFKGMIKQIGSELIEKFNVLSNGSIFMAYSKINDYPSSIIGFGQELREIVKKNKLIMKLIILKIEFGPNPIRENIYVVFIKPTSESDLRVKSFVNDERLIIIINANQIKEIMALN